jgi:hypothetical protein
MKTIYTKKQQPIYVSDRDYPPMSHHRWHYAAGGYAYTYIMVDGVRKKESMHRLLVGAAHGTFVDHRNGIRHDNQRHNIRVCTPKENALNKHGAWGASKYMGVAKAHKNKWRAYITNSETGKQVPLGYFVDQVDAALAYDKAACEFHLEFVWVNLPNPCSFRYRTVYTRCCEEGMRLVS